MKIVKPQRKGSVCNFCYKKINSKYKVLAENKLYYHLSCFYEHLKKMENKLKAKLKEIRKPKYKKIMILERLE
jgi:hypothetical protein